MTKVALFLVIALLTIASADLTQKACKYIVNDTAALYDLLPFANLQKNLSVNVNNGGVLSKDTIEFSLCTRKVTKCKPDKNGENDLANKVYAKYLDPSKNLTDPDHYCTDLTNVESPFFEALDVNNVTSGLKLMFPQFNDGVQTTSFVMELACSREDINLTTIPWSASVELPLNVTDLTARVVRIKGRGPQFCPQATLEGFLEFFDQYKILFAIAFFVIGVLAMGFGLKFFSTVIFIFTALIVGSACFIIIFQAVSVEVTTGIKWVIFVISFCIGAGAGYASTKFEKVGFFALGMLFGVLACLFLYSTFFHLLKISEVVLVILIILFSLVGGGLALWLWKDIIILATSSIGSYLVVRAVSIFLGGFPNELTIARGLTTFSYAAYAYLVAIVVLAVASMVYQFKKKKDDEREEAGYLRESIVDKY